MTEHPPYIPDLAPSNFFLFFSQNAEWVLRGYGSHQGSKATAIEEPHNRKLSILTTSTVETVLAEFQGEYFEKDHTEIPEIKLLFHFYTYFHRKNILQQKKEPLLGSHGRRVSNIIESSEEKNVQIVQPTIFHHDNARSHIAGLDEHYL